MKSVAAFFMICLVAITAIPASAGPASAAKGLTDTERNDLLFIREEEKLARDVYQELYRFWMEQGLELATLYNIQASEQRHFDAVGTLLDRYGVDDPALEPGVFTDASGLQIHYDELISRGKLNVSDAMEVGRDIELMDIEDLTLALGNTSKKDIRNVYTNLRDGSYSHLAAFERALDGQ